MAEINEKKKEKKKEKRGMQNLKWATAHLSRRLGAGLGVLGARLGVQARRQQALGRAGTARACVDRRRARGAG